MYRHFEIEKGKCVSIKLLKKDSFILGKYDSGETLCDLGTIIMRKIRKVVYVTFIKIRRNIYIPGRNIILNAIRSCLVNLHYLTIVIDDYCGHLDHVYENRSHYGHVRCFL